MAQKSAEKKLEKCYKIYEQIYDNPLISYSQTAQNTGMARNTVARHVAAMEGSIMYDPVICLNPAQNYHEYVYFLMVKNPLSAYERLKALFPVISVAFGTWHLLLISDKQIDVSELEGYQECILQEIKGVTHLSKVTTLNWEESMKKMRSMLHPPEEKSFLYEEMPPILWEDWEWALYHRFKHNARIPTAPLLKELEISRKQYNKWFSSLFDVASVQAAFYPLGVTKYLAVDFLFKSDYQRQVADVLGLLPSTSLYFSAGDYLLARLFVPNGKKMRNLLIFIYDMKKKGFFIDFCSSTVISASERLIP